MRQNFLVILLAALLLGATLSACPGPSGSGPAQPAADSPAVAPAEDYQREARASITEENADKELERMEKEIEADSAE